MMLSDIYIKYCDTPSDINEHLPTLMHYARQCRHITEFGFRCGISTVALLMGCPEKLITYDINPACQAIHMALSNFANRVKFEFRLEDTAKAVIEETDFLFIDSAHNFKQCQSELAASGNRARKFIGFHDTVAFGTKDESSDGPGLIAAIESFMQKNPWRVKIHFKNNNGLMILERTMP